MKHVIEMIQNARRLAGPDHPEFLAELAEAERALTNGAQHALDELAAFMHRRSLTPAALVKHATQFIQAMSEDRRKLVTRCESLKAENEKLARMVDQRGDAEAQNDQVRQAQGEPAEAEAEKTPDDTIESVYDSLRQAGAAKLRKYVGQAWCLIDAPPQDCVCLRLGIFDTQHVVLCNVHRCVETGELTRTPIPINKLPRV